MTVAASPAQAVAGRAGTRSRRTWPDPQGAAIVEPRDRAAAGADRVHVDHREPDRDARHHRLGRDLRLSPEDGRDVGARPAHVEGEHVLEAACARDERRPDDPGRRPGKDARSRPGGRRGHIGHSARGLHDERPRLDLLQVRRQHGRQVRVRHGGRAALVLPELGQQLGRERNEHTRQRDAQRVADRPLVLRVQEREEQADRDRLDLRGGNGRDRLPQRRRRRAGRRRPLAPSARAR